MDDPDSMAALVVTGPKEHRIAQVPRPVLADSGEALVDVHYVALCGTDFKLLAGDLHDAEYPVIPGHEWTGVVRAAPSHPELVGARVVGSNFIPCGTCAWCAQGRQQLCTALDELGFSLPGACAESLSIPAANLRPLPENVSMAAGCLIEPLCVAVHAVDRAPDLAGKSVAVLGGGAVGLLVAQVAVAAGARTLTVVEPLASRRALAESLGIEVDAGAGDFEADIVFDVTGTAQAFPAAVERAVPGGAVVLVGYSGTETVAFAPSALMLKELDVFSVLSGFGTLDRALDLVRSGAVRLEPLAAQAHPWRDYASAVDSSAGPVGVRTVLAVAAAEAIEARG